MPHQPQLTATPAPRRPPKIGSRFAPGHARSHAGELDYVIARLPEFDRAPLAAREGSINEFLDVIVRRENVELADTAVPVGVVSRSYRLMAHAEAAGALRAALAATGLHPREMQAEAQLSVYGARMALFARLPRRFDFDPGDGHPLALRVICLNSVDGSSPLRILLGWYRFVCANGLVVGTTRAEWRLVHREGAMPADIAATLQSGLELAQREQHALGAWTAIMVPLERHARFADELVAPAWGALAAARYLHIATTGYDAQFAYPFERSAPSAKTMSPTRRVPGSPAPARTAWDACQALAWIARDRRDQHERVAWMLQIPELMQEMLA
jgi:hypothetical protein